VNIVMEIYAGRFVKWRQLEEERTLTKDIEHAKMLKPRQDELYRLFEQTLETVFAYFSKEPRDEDESLEKEMISSLASLLSGENKQKLATQFLAFLKRVDQKIVALVKTCGPNLDLPSHRSSEECMDAMLTELENTLKGMNSVPSIVTIAKSSSDEFDYTPTDQTDWLLEKNMQLLAKLYGDISTHFDKDVEGEES